VIGIGIAATPLLVAAIAYALSRNLSTRLKDIQAALRDLRRGKAAVSFGALSVEGNDELSDISLSINKMSEQFQTMMQKQEQEKQDLQLQVVKLFKVLAKLAREEKREVQDTDLSDENILYLGKKVRAEMVQRHAEVESYRQQKEDIQRQLTQMLKDIQALTDGDLTVSTQSVDGSLANVAIFFDDVIRGLQNIVSQVKSSANQVNFSLGQNEQAIMNLASVSQRQVDTVTRSLTTMQMSKLSATKIVNNSQQVVKSSQLVSEKLSESDRSIDAVMSKVGELQNTISTTAKRVKHLGVVSQKIAKAISSINEIAIKTNFLAINATLEASRSTDTNQGFVLVAEEVGELAARSVAATKEVESLLSNIQSETNAVMAVVDSGSTQISESNALAITAKDSLQQIARISQQIDGLMVVIAEATTSQAQTSEGVANLMNDISHMAKRTLASSSEVSKFIKATRGYSGELQQSLSNFKTR
jgi:methyl-accepting chemotaxis protein